MTIDPRLADRRRKVAEDRARSNLRRLLRVMVILAGAAAAVWTLQSPFLSVSEVVVTGAAEVDVDQVMARHQIVEGRPMVLLDVDGAEAALEGDAWVVDAEVARDWPTRVVVTVSERVPAATVRFSDGWFLLAADGKVLDPVEAETQPRPPTASFPAVASSEAGADRAVAGAVEFLVALPPSLAAQASVTTGPEGLEAVVVDFIIRLGRPFDMGEKATVTAEILATGLEEGSVVTVVAPASPAVLPPGGHDTSEDEDSGEGSSAPNSTP